MTDGLSLSLQAIPEPIDTPSIDLTTPAVPDCLYSFAAWIDLNSPPPAMIAGMLELLGNELYRQARFSEGNELKHVAQQLREENPPLITQRKRQMQPNPLETGYHGRVHDEDPTCHPSDLGDISCQPVESDAP